MLYTPKQPMRIQVKILFLLVLLKLNALGRACKMEGVRIITKFALYSYYLVWLSKQCL